jgi:hypothetical protein
MAGPRRMEDAFADGLRQVRSKLSGTVRTISGNLTLVDGDTDVQAINGGGSNRDVTLPAATDQNEGRLFEIWNTGSTNSLVIKNAGGSTLFTLTFGHVALARQIAGTWRAAGTVTDTNT